ncbi:MAG TPA: helical backbone metal receptor [Vicinamibacterales bacterium]|nr:helical backbone metal receptor [Vicinamibacterales bacterium]
MAAVILGGTVLVASQPQPRRIISLIPAVTEMLFALEAGDRVVAVGSFDKYPPEVEKLPKVGALLDPDLERILSLRPDLVAVYGSQADLRTQLERGGVAMFVYAHAGLADVTTTIRELGTRIGADARAAGLVRDIEERLASVRRSVAGRPRPKTLVVFGREALALRNVYASGGIGFVHDMVTAAGGDNVFADVNQQAVQATTELIITRRPDVILELRAEPLSRDAEQKERAVWNRLGSVPAVRNGRVYILVDRRTVIPGPRVGEGVEVIARLLHRLPW